MCVCVCLCEYVCVYVCMHHLSTVAVCHFIFCNIFEPLPNFDLDIFSSNFVSQITQLGEKSQRGFVLLFLFCFLNRVYYIASIKSS